MPHCQLRVWWDGRHELWALPTEVLTVQLPSEAQWEKAARGRDGRLFPWGDKADPNRANHIGAGIGTTSAVGCFPGGASIYGVEEMSGNVWEWTRSLWGRDWRSPEFGYPYQPEDGREDLWADSTVRRVLRGGAFNYADRFARCACRVAYSPLKYPWYFGFRLVVSPVCVGRVDHDASPDVV